MYFITLCCFFCRINNGTYIAHVKTCCCHHHCHRHRCDLISSFFHDYLHIRCFTCQFKSNARETWHAILVSFADIYLTESLCFCPFHLSFYTSARNSFPLQQSPASQEFLEMCKMNNSQEGTFTCPSGNSFICTFTQTSATTFYLRSSTKSFM